MNDAIEVKYYTSEEGVVLEIYERFSQPRINGVDAEPLFLNGWYIVRGQHSIDKLEMDGGKRRINERYELRNSALACAPAVIQSSDLHAAGGFESGQYSGMRELYDYKYEEEQVGFVERAFTLVNKGQLTFANIGDPTSFSYSMGSEIRGYDRIQTEIRVTWQNIYDDHQWSRVLSVDEIQRVMTPKIAWHLGPCSITSESTYKIVRAHVKANILSAVAEVTSDYDFCFGVAKRFAIKPYTYQSEYKPGPRRKPRMVTNTVTFGKRPLFEMTHSGGGLAPYKGYTPIAGFTGSSLADLAANIDHYLESLMEAINEPLARCQTCDGCGVVNYWKIPTNARNLYALRNEHRLIEGGAT